MEGLRHDALRNKQCLYIYENRDKVQACVLPGKGLRHDLHIL